jgi:hypothetical protein
MASSLKGFKASELAEVLGVKLGRGRPSAGLRASLEATVNEERAAGTVKVRGGKLVRV